MRSPAALGSSTATPQLTLPPLHPLREGFSLWFCSRDCSSGRIPSSGGRHRAGALAARDPQGARGGRAAPHCSARYSRVDLLVDPRSSASAPGMLVPEPRCPPSPAGSARRRRLPAALGPPRLIPGAPPSPAARGAAPSPSRQHPRAEPRDCGTRSRERGPGSPGGLRPHREASRCHERAALTGAGTGSAALQPVGKGPGARREFGGDLRTTLFILIIFPMRSPQSGAGEREAEERPSHSTTT